MKTIDKELPKRFTDALSLNTCMEKICFDGLELFRILDSNYFLSKCGKAYSNFNKTGRAKVPFRKLSEYTRNGYPSMRADLGEGIKHYTIHRIMALMFLEKNPKYSQVNHINGIKTDNNIENLEWCNASLNMLHAYEKGLMIAQGNRKGFSGKLCPNSKSVNEYDINGNFIKNHESLSLTKLDGFRPSSVSKNCKGKTYSYKNRIFKLA